MAKDKKGSKAAAVAPQVAKPTEKVKAGRVTKPSETPKAASKVSAKETAKVVEKKKSKKSKKEPTPEPSSEEEEATSDSSASSEDEEETVPVKTGSKTNGAAAKDDSSDDDSDDEDEAPPAKAAAPKANGKANGAVNGKAKADSSDEDDSDDDEEDVKAGAVKDTKMADADDDSSDDSEEDDDDEAAAKLKPNGEAEEDDDEDDSDDSDDEEEEEKPAAEEKPSKKRKAEAETQSTPKRSKVMIDGEMKDATNNLFVGQLSWNMDEEWLTREFEEFGELTGVRIITDRDSGRSKGFGYIEFKDVESAIAAVEAKNGTELDGRNIRLDFSQPRAERDNNQTPQQKGAARAQQYGDTPKEPSSTLFVGNVSFEADENMVTEMFSEYGTIKAVRLPTDRDTGALKGFGYVEMSSIDEATAAFEAVQGADLAGRPVRLDYASARPDNGGSGGRGGFGDRGGRGGRGGFDRGGRGGGRGRGGFGDRGGRGGGRGRGGFGDRGGRGGGRGGTTNRGGFGDFSGKKMTF
ncbi:nuclear localization sequence binding protein [Recurvomyces mirabilis]|uniref:nuclear localization sequence binding protein n=1 Tax=Recurvomyces mirabilis TaxID=574656 RepID=UPI002DE0FE75|nr:nuclear localization sequence binding protein [Recurvomyces mirabilis]